MDGRGFGCGSRNFSKITNLDGLRKHFTPEIQHASLTIIINNSDIINNKYFHKNSSIEK